MLAPSLCKALRLYGKAFWIVLSIVKEKRILSRLLCLKLVNLQMNDEYGGS